MAVLWFLNRIILKSARGSYLAALSSAGPQFYCKSVHIQADDVLDSFTSQLMQKKANKWESIKTRNQLAVEHLDKVNPIVVNTLEPNVRNLEGQQIVEIFQEALDNENIPSLRLIVDSCNEHRKIPPLWTLINSLSLFAQNGDKTAISQIQKLCTSLHPDTLKLHSNFDHFMAEAIWIKGDIPKSLDLFEGIYRNNAFLRRRVRLILKNLITDSMSNKSEAILWKIIHFSERLLADFQDFFPVTCVWQACFLSEWFTDQCIALELLERNDGLCKSVINRIPYVVFVSLKAHRTEVVYRLLEILLKYEMKQQYSTVLVALLDYQFQCRDLKSCNEIIRWAIAHNVELPGNHHMKLINLLLHEKLDTPMIQMKAKRNDKKPNLDLKF